MIILDEENRDECNVNEFKLDFKYPYTKIITLRNKLNDLSCYIQCDEIENYIKNDMINTLIKENDYTKQFNCHFLNDLDNSNFVAYLLMYFSNVKYIFIYNEKFYYNKFIFFEKILYLTSFFGNNQFYTSIKNYGEYKYIKEKNRHLTSPIVMRRMNYYYVGKKLNWNHVVWLLLDFIIIRFDKIHQKLGAYYDNENDYIQDTLCVYLAIMKHNKYDNVLFDTNSTWSDIYQYMLNHFIQSLQSLLI